MTISPAELLRAKLQGIMSTLGRAPSRERQARVSVALAKDFNGVMESAKEQFPEIASAVPAPVPFRGPHRKLGQADVTFLDLETLCEQLLNLLALVDQQ